MDKKYFFFSKTDKEDGFIAEFKEENTYFIIVSLSNLLSPIENEHPAYVGSIPTEYIKMVE